MPDSTENRNLEGGSPNDVWVLALVGVPAATLLSPGEWTIIDSAVGVLLIMVLSCVDTSSHGLRFRLAYSGIFGMALLLILGLPMDLVIYAMKLHEKLLFNLPDGPSLSWNELIQVVVWVSVSSVSYLVNRTRP